MSLWSPYFKKVDIKRCWQVFALISNEIFHVYFSKCWKQTVGILNCALDSCTFVKGISTMQHQRSFKWNIYTYLTSWLWICKCCKFLCRTILLKIVYESGIYRIIYKQRNHHIFFFSFFVHFNCYFPQMTIRIYQHIPLTIGTPFISFMVNWKQICVLWLTFVYKQVIELDTQHGTWSLHVMDILVTCAAHGHHMYRTGSSHVQHIWSHALGYMHLVN